MNAPPSGATVSEHRPQLSRRRAPYKLAHIVFKTPRPQQMLAAVRPRRAFPIMVTQTLQRIFHRVPFDSVLRGKDFRLPAVVFGVIKLMPWLSKVPAYPIGVGVRPEHAPACARRGSHACDA
jgi:hypothetical protein